MNEERFNALLTLLDDDDQNISHQIQEELAQHGHQIIAKLEQAWELHRVPRLQRRLEEVVNEIHLRDLILDYDQWLNSGSHDLVDLGMILSRFQFPGIDIIHYRNRLQQVLDDCFQEVGEFKTPIEHINAINQAIFRQHNFRSITDEVNPYHNYLSTVLDSKKASPVGLSLFYAAIAQRLGFAVYAVGIPQQLILAFCRKPITAFEETSGRLASEVLFYVSPVNHGMIFTKQEITEFLKKVNVDLLPEYFAPISNRALSQRLISFLQATYMDHQQPEKAELLERLSKVSL